MYNDLHEGILVEFAERQRWGSQRYELPTDNHLAKRFRFKARNPGYSHLHRKRLDAELKARRAPPSPFWADIAARARW